MSNILDKPLEVGGNDLLHDQNSHLPERACSVTSACSLAPLVPTDTKPFRTVLMARVLLPRISGERLCMVEVLPVLDFLVRDMLPPIPCPINNVPERNMYLAEDRILCFEIVTKKREGWM